MAVRRYCKNCGHELGQQYRFCPNCGARRPSDVAPVAPSDRTDSTDGNIHLRRIAALCTALIAGALLGGVLALGCTLLGIEPDVGGGFGLIVAFGVAVYLIDKINKTGEERGTPISSVPPVRSRSIPQWVKIAVATRDGGKCRRCGSAHDLQYDHVTPFSRGGSSIDVNNIQLLCGRCNRLKSNRYIG
jgi:hypothetical protein